MADTLKVLGQSAPTATVLTAAYTAGAMATVSSISVCNTHATNLDTVRISVAIGGAADTIAQYICYNTDILPKGSFILTVGITMAATDIIRVYSLNGTSSFNIFGVEVT